MRRYSARTMEVASPRGWSDAAIRYDDGSLAYDYPERIPQYVKRAVARAMAEG